MPCPHCWGTAFGTALRYGAEGVTGTSYWGGGTCSVSVLRWLRELVSEKAALQPWLAQLAFAVELQLPLRGLEIHFFLKIAAILLHDFKPAAIGIHLGETQAVP